MTRSSARQFSRVRVLSILFIAVAACAVAQEKDEGEDGGIELRQYYSGKLGFYHPDPSLNNGLILGVDGLTEFVHTRFAIMTEVDYYQKQTVSTLVNPPPFISRQSLTVIPIHINLAWKIFDAYEVGGSASVGIGGGGYLYFYSIEYPTAGGSVITDQRTGGNAFGSAFARFLVGRFFIEPRIFIASKSRDTAAGSLSYVVNPSGYSIMVGIQSD